MKSVRPILFEQCDIALPGLRVRRFSLNRHLPETNWIREHAHSDHEQLLLYLTGRGTQRIGNTRQPVVVGSVVWLPRRQSHAFVKTQVRDPLCLAVDLERISIDEPRHRILSTASLATIKRELIDLGSATFPRTAALMLSITGRCLEAISYSDLPNVRNDVWVGRLKGLLKNGHPLSSTPKALAEALGVSLDHLNRALKTECGLTVGQWLGDERLSCAKQLLQNQSTALIQDIAKASGIHDPNYFSRWFREQTGVTPKKWRNRNNQHNM